MFESKIHSRNIEDQVRGSSTPSLGRTMPTCRGGAVQAMKYEPIDSKHSLVEIAKDVNVSRDQKGIGRASSNHNR